MKQRTPRVELSTYFFFLSLLTMTPEQKLIECLWPADLSKQLFEVLGDGLKARGLTVPNIMELIEPFLYRDLADKEDWPAIVKMVRRAKGAAAVRTSTTIFRNYALMFVDALTSEKAVHKSNRVAVEFPSAIRTALIKLVNDAVIDMRDVDAERERIVSVER
jgi:hypothetical protein